MKEETAKQQLIQEGFLNVYVWEDAPKHYYPNHQHEHITAHVILKGELVLTMNGRSETYKAGDRFDVPAGIVHSARSGDKGCKYLTGE